jgi:putative transposase
LTLFLKLLPTHEQASALLQTMERFNQACDVIAEVAFEYKVANKVKLQKLVYYSIRERFGLAAQLTVRAIAKVAEAYKRDKSIKPSFRPHGAIVYDQRLLSFKGLDKASILTLQGRQTISFVIGGYQRERIAAYGIRGQADLIYRKGVFYLAVVVEVPDAIPKGGDFLGVDMGIVNLAFDSDGESYCGDAVERNRRIFAHRRRNLQHKGTRSAKRKLRKISGRQRRFQSNTNHIISKRVVAKAKGTGRGIALENLRGIRDRTMVRKPQRARHANWAFYQLGAFVRYKAVLAGVRVLAIDPRNTSRMCSECGHTDKANRVTQSLFLCGQCNFSVIADYNAALNLRARAVVMLPMVANLSPVSKVQLQATAL